MQTKVVIIRNINNNGVVHQFHKKVRESRFIKVRDRQVNKFNRLVGKYKDRELTAQPLANTSQLQAQSNPNK